MIDLDHIDEELLEFFNNELADINNSKIGYWGKDCKKFSTTKTQRTETKIKKTISWIKRNKRLPKRNSEDEKEKMYFSVVTAARSKNSNYSSRHPELQKKLISLIEKYK